ncbi:MAG: methyltransferase domain-containing protein, partial [Myxococcales bacterium]|nr:methyltransferase domain-containing protein [Myxococcales bacterium]
MADVSRYYEANTRWFLRFGQTTGGPGVIHRGIWGDGVTTTLEALDHVHRLIQARVPSGTRVLDLGCGVGGSLCRLVELDPTLKGTGVTISPTQARLAAQRGPGQRFLTADFHDLPASLGTFDAAYAIEAWAHATDPDAFMASTAGRLAPGGLLLLIDDFVGDDGGPVG